MGSSLSTLTPQETTELRNLIDKQIQTNKIMIYSKTHCPYCHRAKSELDKLKLNYSVIELDRDDHGSSIQALLAEKTGQKTVPNIFINRAHVGGCDDLLEKIRTGEVYKLLSAS
ncbi:hypothetical protein BB559_003617 [Furculomyces boomerangus]|uniref:Glutaredoxin domain-containing protein n=2 Tax=Harpellales TaxID=61421 RepID=A0A2T9YK87_9FUNG|nr:hypothetical protein BB559_003617 [Furculomyces boomerangus]PVZ98092.1 hypothetical protein BB558_005922 [Smittium angustum]